MAQLSGRCGSIFTGQGGSATPEYSSRKRREEKAQLTSVAAIILRDQKKISREIRKWDNSHQLAEKQLNHLNNIFEKTKAAAQFFTSASHEIKELLRNPMNWKNYPEFDYVNDLGAIY